MEAHIKLVFQHAGHQSLADDDILSGLNDISYLTEAPDVYHVLLAFLNRACCSSELCFFVRLLVQELLQEVVFDLKAAHNLSHCADVDAEFDGG